jgi:hypothetical protein
MLDKQTFLPVIACRQQPSTKNLYSEATVGWDGKSDVKIMPPTTYRTTTIALAKVKAKHIANQAGLNRLQELLVKAASNPNNGQNYAITIKRALKSLQECKEPILTQKDAVKLKFIGPAMAKKYVLNRRV